MVDSKRQFSEDLLVITTRSSMISCNRWKRTGRRMADKAQSQRSMMQREMSLLTEQLLAPLGQWHQLDLHLKTRHTQRFLTLKRRGILGCPSRTSRPSFLRIQMS